MMWRITFRRVTRLVSCLVKKKRKTKGKNIFLEAARYPIFRLFSLFLFELFKKKSFFSLEKTAEIEKNIHIIYTNHLRVCVCVIYIENDLFPSR